MRRNKSVSKFAAMALVLLLIPVLPGAGLAVGTCRKEGKCLCTKEQERRGMKTVDGDCIDCAGNARLLHEATEAKKLNDRDQLTQRLLQEQAHTGSNKSWADFQEELPHFADAARGYVDLPGAVRGIGRAIENDTPGGPFQLRSSLKRAYEDLSRMAHAAEAPLSLGRVADKLTDSVRYADEYLRAMYAIEDLQRRAEGIDGFIEETRRIVAKCDGKGKQKSEQKTHDPAPSHAATLPVFRQLVASEATANSPCRISNRELSRCQEAQQELMNIRSFDFPETSVAFGDARLILEPFSRDNANQIPDQEVLQRAKQVAPALKKLAGLLDRLVSRSNKFLALLQGGGT